MSFADFCKDYQIPYATEGNPHCRPGWVQLDCPFCGHESGRFHLGVSLNSFGVNCWKCGKHSLWELIGILSGEFPKRIIAKYGLSASRIERRDTISAPAGFYDPPKNLKPLSGSAQKYLLSRGFDPGEIEKKWGVLWTGSFGNLANRVFLPIRDRNGKLVSWTTRSIGNPSAKYISAPARSEFVPSKHILYGEDFVFGDSIIVCEGPLDVWKMGGNTVCTFGTSLSDTQIRHISHYKNICVLFDSDDAGKKSSDDLTNKLSVLGKNVFQASLDGKNDPGDLSKQEAFQLYDEIMEAMNE